MIKFFTSIYKNLTDFFDRYFVAVTIVVGVVFLIYGLSSENPSERLCKILYTIGSISLTSGIFAGIAKSNQFTEIYKKIFRDIIYGNEHLEKRNDLEKIWENVTQTLSNQKFKKISELMNKNIKKYFLPLEHDYYYDNFNIEINIEFLNDNPDYIVLKEITSYTIICDDENLVINNRYLSTLKIDPSKKELSVSKLAKLTIDNIVQKDLKIITKIDKNILSTSYEKELSSRKNYNIKREDEKTYNINYNPIRKQLAVWIYNNCIVDITFPKGLSVDIHSLGVLDNFKIDDRSNNNFNRLKAEYKGLIYKNQGFFMHFTKN